MIKIDRDTKYLISIWILLGLAICATIGHQGNFLVDCGREVYYPTQILLGKVLFKDIFNIYGPFSYMFNAALFKWFGANLNVLYIAGCISATGIVTLTYLISRKFLSHLLSFAISLYAIATGVLNTNLFNFVFPYSFAMLYGIVSFLISIWSLLKFQETEKNLYLYLSCFFAGLCISNKYEFAPYIIVIIYALFNSKQLKFKQYYYAVISFIFVPAICFGTLFLQGLTLQDISRTAHLINNMAKSQTLKYFYTAQGVFFNKFTLPVIFITLLKTLIPLSLFYFVIKIKNKLLSIITTTIAAVLIILCTSAKSFMFIPICLVLLLVIFFKKIFSDKKLFYFVTASILVSLKVFWGLTTINYGVYFTSLLLISILATAKYLLKDKGFNENTIGSYILISAVIMAMFTLIMPNYKLYQIKTAKGNIYTEKALFTATDSLISYINANTKKTDKIVILPEGTFINFLTNRQSDNYYNSMIPLYDESFGDNDFIQHFSKTKPEYIIFHNWDMSKDYYFRNICNDYAQNFCSYVAKNYKLEKIVGSEFRYLIYKSDNKN